MRFALWLALWLCSACPVDTPTTGTFDFSCQSPDDCAEGYFCSGQRCVADGQDAGLVPTDAASSDHTVTDVITVDALSLDTSQPDAPQYDSVLPDTAATDSSRPDVPLLDVSLTDTSQTDSSRSDSSRPDSSLSDASPRDTSTPDTSQPDTSQPDTSQPDTSQPDTSQPDTSQPDTSQPDAMQPDASGDPWAQQGWTRRRRIDVNNGDVDQALGNFPVLVRLDENRIDYGLTAAGGADLRFVTPGGAQLPHEIDSWANSGESIVWVRLNTLPTAGSGIWIWMYYGNDEAQDDQRAAEVWSADYVGVWHLNPDLQDSSASGSHATDHSTVDAVGLLAAGRDIGDVQNHYLEVDDLDMLNSIDDGVCFSAWVYRQSAQSSWSTVGGRSRGTGSQNHFLMGFRDDQYIDYIVTGTGGSWYASPTSRAPVQTWIWVALTYDGAAVQLWVDGAPLADATHSISGSFTDDTTIMHIGADTDNGTSSYDYNLDGIVDEVRLARVGRSATWMRLQNASMRDQLLSFGAAEIIGP